MSEGKSYLPTTPGTRLEWSTPRPWCAGHRWKWRRGLGWLHHLGHRARVLRVKANAYPLVYVSDTKAADPALDGQRIERVIGYDHVMLPRLGQGIRAESGGPWPPTPPGGDFPCCAPLEDEADPPLFLLYAVGLMLADVLTHPEGIAEVVRRLQADPEADPEADP